MVNSFVQGHQLRRGQTQDNRISTTDSLLDSFVGLPELSDHALSGVLVNNEDFHLLCQQLTGVTNVDGRLLLVPRQYPDLDFSLAIPQKC